MNLPKYMPGLVVIVNERPHLNEETGEQETDIYPDGLGMFVIAEAFLEHEEWHYQNYDGKIQMHESEIVGVINNGYYVAADRFNGVVEAPEQAPDIKESLEELAAGNTEEEEAFIKKNSKRVRKIEVKDGNEQASE